VHKIDFRRLSFKINRKITQNRLINMNVNKNAPAYRTRSNAKRLEKEAAEMLMELSKVSVPKTLPTLSRTLSHSSNADQDVRVYMEICQEGESILKNFWCNKDGEVTLEYITKKNGQFIEYKINKVHISKINQTWRYNGEKFEDIKSYF
jgi:hypothetical protein